MTSYSICCDPVRCTLNQITQTRPCFNYKASHSTPNALRNHQGNMKGFTIILTLSFHALNSYALHLGEVQCIPIKYFFQQSEHDLTSSPGISVLHCFLWMDHGSYWPQILQVIFGKRSRYIPLIILYRIKLSCHPLKLKYVFFQAFPQPHHFFWGWYSVRWRCDENSHFFSGTYKYIYIYRYYLFKINTYNIYIYIYIFR